MISRPEFRPLSSSFTLIVIYTLSLVSKAFSSDQLVIIDKPDHSLNDFTNFSVHEDFNSESIMGTGPLSDWARYSKKLFFEDCTANRADEWVIVMGNEAGDTDSLAAAIGWAYHLSNVKKNPQKAIALLQTVEDALDLRPENQLALNRSQMAPRHRDLLTIDELPIKPFELSRHIKGVVLVDHNNPTPGWLQAPILSIIDHHQDRNLNLSAKPRLIEPSASCSSHVAKLVLDSEEKEPHNIYRNEKSGIPVDLVDLLLRAIAIDSSGLKENGSYKVDRQSALRLYRLSQWYKPPSKLDGKFKRREKAQLLQLMQDFNDEMDSARAELEELDLRDLFRRDWKTIAVKTLSKKYYSLTLGFGSIPYSLEDQIERTPEKTSPEWFAIERAFTAEIGADVSIILSKHVSKRTGKKERQLVVVVAHGWGKRLSSSAATDLFDTICKSIQDGISGLSPWKRPDGHELLPRRMAWKIEEDGTKVRRKLLMPIINKAVAEWDWVD